MTPTHPVTLAVPCVRRYDLLQKLFESAELGSVKPDRYLVVDNGTTLPAERAAGRIRLPESTVVYSPGRNMGVSASWNYIFQHCPDWVIVANDDIELGKETLESFVACAESTDAEFISSAAGATFCLFLMKHGCYSKVGGFDEVFYPAYFEDNDYHWRMKAVPIKETRVDHAAFTHVGSAWLKSMTPQERGEHDHRFRCNQEYYCQKWGGLPGHETKKP
jgi:GT2 family glycosyltransferase